MDPIGNQVEVSRSHQLGPKKDRTAIPSGQLNPIEVNEALSSAPSSAHGFYLESFISLCSDFFFFFFFLPAVGSSISIFKNFFSALATVLLIQKGYLVHQILHIFPH